MRQHILLIIALGCCDHALACLCGEASIADYYSQASNVFRARIQSVDLSPVPEHLKDNSWLNPSGSGDKSRVVQGRFELLETYKGSQQQLDAVYTSPHWGFGCGLRIVDGSQYVFFADAKGVVTMCGGNTRRRLFSRKFKDTIKELKRIISQQLGHETTVTPKAPDKAR